MKFKKFREIYGQELRDEYLMNSSVDKNMLVIHCNQRWDYVPAINKLLKIDIEESDAIEFVLIEFDTLKRALDCYDLLAAGIDTRFCASDVWSDGKRVRSTDDP
jgi:hypothetical protein